MYACHGHPSLWFIAMNLRGNLHSPGADLPEGMDIAIDGEYARETIIEHMADLTRKVKFERIEAQLIQYEIIDQEFADEYNYMSNTKKIMQALLELQRTNLTQTYIIFLNDILGKGGLQEKECRDMLWTSYRRKCGK